MTNNLQRPSVFETPAQEAAFWDTHSFAEYWRDLKPAPVEFAPHLSEDLTVRFDAPILVALRQQAGKQGIEPTTLIRL